eukprot:CAMPEP_0194374136 /NCGR_PEP_ID=MMETSP0174-20130528/22513_1 /TAXON_ID=216777 /ORGANISM="Proboscia alata, Strain PI-D3" /LENGTH=382 /DNA_ID=CAMNT_0039153513 /DNA_START=74 /DNA_END=1222 /DNA_ORIENTATION=-
MHFWKVQRQYYGKIKPSRGMKSAAQNTKSSTDYATSNREDSYDSPQANLPFVESVSLDREELFRIISTQEEVIRETRLENKELRHHALQRTDHICSLQNEILKLSELRCSEQQNQNESELLKIENDELTTECDELVNDVNLLVEEADQMKQINIAMEEKQKELQKELETVVLERDDCAMQIEEEDREVQKAMNKIRCEMIRLLNDASIARERAENSLAQSKAEVATLKQDRDNFEELTLKLSSQSDSVASREKQISQANLKLCQLVHNLTISNSGLQKKLNKRKNIRRTYSEADADDDDSSTITTWPSVADDENCFESKEEINQRESASEAKSIPSEDRSTRLMRNVSSGTFSLKTQLQHLKEISENADDISSWATKIFSTH